MRIDAGSGIPHALPLISALVYEVESSYPVSFRDEE